MRMSPHMVRCFDSDSKGGQILQKLEQRFFGLSPNGLWLEWSPQHIVPRHDGYRIRRIKGNGWRMLLSITGEPRYVARVGDVSEATIKDIESFLDKELGIAPAKPKKQKGEKDMRAKQTTQLIEPNANGLSKSPVHDQTSAPDSPPVPPQNAVKKPTSRIQPTPENVHLAFMAIEEIIRIENILAQDGWFYIKGLSSKILDIINSGKPKDPNAYHSIKKILEELTEKLKVVEIRRENMTTAWIRFPIKKHPPSMDKPPASAPAAPTEKSAGIQEIREQLLALRFSQLHELQQLAKKDEGLRELLKFLLQ